MTTVSKHRQFVLFPAGVLALAASLAGCKTLDHLDGYSGYQPSLATQSRMRIDREFEEEFGMAGLDAEIIRAAPVKSVPVPAAPAPVEAWQAAAGQDLRGVLAGWSAAEGVELIWNAPGRYRLEEPVQIEGRYEDAVLFILEQFAGRENPPAGRLHIDQGNGARHLVIESF